MTHKHEFKKALNWSNIEKVTKMKRKHNTQAMPVTKDAKKRRK